MFRVRRKRVKEEIRQLKRKMRKEASAKETTAKKAKLSEAEEKHQNDMLESYYELKKKYTSLKKLHASKGKSGLLHL